MGTAKVAVVTTRGRGRPKKNTVKMDEGSCEASFSMKVVEIDMPLTLLHYCIQPRRPGQVTGVKATVLNGEDISISVCQTDGRVNLQLEGDFPVITKEDRLCCRIHTVDLMTSPLEVNDTESDVLITEITGDRLQSNSSRPKRKTKVRSFVSDHVSKSTKRASLMHEIRAQPELTQMQGCQELCTAPMGTGASSVLNSDPLATDAVPPGETVCAIDDITHVVASRKGLQTRLSSHKDSAAKKNGGVHDSGSTIKLRSKLSSKRGMQCVFCKATFTKKLGLKRHLLKKHNNAWEEHSYSMSVGMETNVNSTDSNADKLTVETSGANQEPSVAGLTTERGVERIPCPVCAKTLHNNSYLLAHVRYRHQAYTDLEQLETLIREGASTRITMHAGVDIKGEQLCEPTTTSNRKKQTRDQSDDTACLDCPECHMSYTESKTIVKHVRKAHSQCVNYPDLLMALEEMLYKKRRKNKGPDEYVSSTCKLCQAERVGRSIFRHLEMCHRSNADYSQIHGQALTQYLLKVNASRKERKRAYETEARRKGKIYICQYCSRQFKQRPAKSNHENFRCKDNPARRKLFDCYTCGFSTGNSDTFQVHKQKHAGDAGATNACDKCSRKYQTRAGLVIHRRKAHNIFSKVPIVYLDCDQCDKKFYDKDHLRKHKATHSNERPYQCELCGQQYKSSHAVSKHQSMFHHNRYKYHCDKCGHGVEKEHYLKKHVCGRVRRVQDQENTPLLTFGMAKKAKKQTRLATETTEQESSGDGAFRILDRDDQLVVVVGEHLTPAAQPVCSESVASSGASISKTNINIQELMDNFITTNALSDHSLANYIQYANLSHGSMGSGGIAPGNSLSHADIAQVLSKHDDRNSLPGICLTGPHADMMAVESDASNTAMILDNKVIEASESADSSKALIQIQMMEPPQDMLEPLEQPIALSPRLEHPVTSVPGLMAPVASSLQPTVGLVPYPVKEEAPEGVSETVSVPLDCLRLLNLTSGGLSFTWNAALGGTQTPSVASSTILTVPSVLFPQQATMSLPQHTQATLSLPQHTQATLSLPQHTQATMSLPQHTQATMSLPQHTQATMSLPQYTQATKSLPQHLQPIVSLPQHLQPAVASPYITLPPVSLASVTLPPVTLNTTGMQNATTAKTCITMAASTSSVRNLPSITSHLPIGATSTPNLQNLLSASSSMIGRSMSETPLIGNPYISHMIPTTLTTNATVPLSLLMGSGQASITSTMPLPLSTLDTVTTSLADLCGLLSSPVPSPSPVITTCTTLSAGSVSVKPTGSVSSSLQTYLQ